MDTSTKIQFDFEGGPAGVKGGAKGVRGWRNKVGGRTAKAKPIRAMMPRHQPRGPFGFLREETYAISNMGRVPKAGVKRPPKAAIFDVLNEAGRLSPEGYRHLTLQGMEPKPPRTLHGVEPQGLMDWLMQHMLAAEKHTQEQRFPHKTVVKKRPSNVPTLLGVVASYPGQADDSSTNYCRWRELVLDWALQHYGAENLVSVLEHTDEPNGHIHILVATPKADRVVPLSPGYRAYHEAMKEGKSRAEAEAARSAAFGALQDEFHAAVSAHLGFSRRSPDPSARYSYEEHKVRQRLAHEVALIEAELDEKKAALEARAVELERDARTTREQLMASVDQELSSVALAMKHAYQVKEARLKAQLEAERESLAKDRERQAQERERLTKDQEAIARGHAEVMDQGRAVREWLLDQVSTGAITKAEGRELALALKLKLDGLGKDFK